MLKESKLTCRINRTAITNSINKLLNQFNISCRVFNNNTIVLLREKKASETYKDTIIVRQNFQVIDTVSFLIEPRKISKDDPIYPAAAIEKNINGSVKVKLKINKEGTVCKSYIENSSGYPILDSATTAYANTLKFSPAMENGKPKDIWIYMTFKYVIDE